MFLVLFFLHPGGDYNQREQEKKKTPKKVAAKRPRDHDDPAVIQVFEAQVHYFNLLLFGCI